MYNINYSISFMPDCPAFNAHAERKCISMIKYYFSNIKYLQSINLDINTNNKLKIKVTYSILIYTQFNKPFSCLITKFKDKKSSTFKIF